MNQIRNFTSVANIGSFTPAVTPIAVKTATVQPALVRPAAVKIPASELQVSSTVRPIQTALVRPATVKIPASELQVNNVRFVNPELSIAMASIQFLATGVPRNQMTLPVSNAIEVTDQILFEEATDATKKFYLPRYRIATQTISGQSQYRISLAGSGTGGVLTLYLEKYPAEQLGLSARDAKELPHEVAVILKYVLANSGGIQKELSFQEVVQEGNLFRVVLHVNTLPEKDELFYALTNRDYHTELIIRRTAKMAVPLNVQPPAINLIELAADSQSRWVGGRLIDAHNNVDNVNLAWMGGEGDSQGFVRVDNNVVMEDGNSYSPVLRTHPKWVNQGTIKGWLSWRMLPTGAKFQAKIGFLNGAVHTDGVTFWVWLHYKVNGREQWIPIIQRVKQYSRSLDYIEYDLSAYAGQSISIELRVDAGASSGQDWAAWVNPMIVGVPLFRETTRVLDNAIPQYFDRDIHRYIFSDLPSPTGSKSGMKRWSVKWEEQDHNYYQEVTRPEVVYYLPDAFKLVRRPQAPHTPLMAITIESLDDSAEATQVTLDYSAFKYEDMDRLGDAAKKLKALLALSPEKQLIFMPLGADSSKTKFTVKLPRAGVNETRTNATVTTKLGLKDSLTLPMNDFLSIWDALAGTGSPVLFQGEVEIDLGEDKEQIPFVAQLNDMVGSLLDYTGEYDVGSGMLKARLRNAIESKVRINNLTVKLSGDSVNFVSGKIQKTWPIELNPDEEISLDILPASALTGTGSVTVAFDFDEVDVLPDFEKISTSLMLGQKPQLTRKIPVKTFAPLFGSTINNINIEFEHGSSVILSPAQLQGEALVRVSLTDRMAYKDTADQIRYRVIAERGDGVFAGEWQTSTSNEVMITNDVLPKVR